MTPGIPQPQLVNGKAQAQTAAIQKVFDVGVGRYDVTVSVGPSYQSKRQEAVASQMALVQAFPNIMAFIGDLLVGNMDWPGAKEMAERLKKMLPKELQDDPDDVQAQAQQLVQQHAALTQEVQQLSQQLQQASQVIATKQAEQQAKIEIERLKLAANAESEKLQAETKILIAEITTKAQSERERAQMYIDIWKELHGGATDAALSAQEHAQTIQQSAQTHQQTLEQGQQAADNQASMAQQQQPSEATPQEQPQ